MTVCGDGEYIIYTALAWRNKAFGSGLGFAWASDSNTYAVRESGSKIRVYRAFKERLNLVQPGYAVEDINGGNLLGVIGNGFVCFYDWDTGALVRRIEVEAKNVSARGLCDGKTRLPNASSPANPCSPFLRVFQIYWSGTGSLVAITSEDSFYVLRFDRDAYNEFLEAGNEMDDEGVEDAFELVAEIPEK